MMHNNKNNNAVVFGVLLSAYCLEKSLYFKLIEYLQRLCDLSRYILTSKGKKPELNQRR